MSVEKTIDSLKRKGYKVSYFQGTDEAANYLIKTLNGTTICFENSDTLKPEAL